jgi:hypothetical protein
MNKKRVRKLCDGKRPYDITIDLTKEDEMIPKYLSISGLKHSRGHSNQVSLMSMLFFVTVMLLFPTPPASADSLSYEAGIGFYVSRTSTANLLRYQHETTPLFGFPSYYEASYASWNGPNHADAVCLARGLRWARTSDEYLSLTAGLSHINRTTSNLGQPFEIYARLAYEKSVGKALFSIGWIHYSDAKLLFGWSGPNKSENFATLSLGMIF